ncbi:type IV pilin [Chromobacterium alticapitis]|uniref:Type IV pilin n=2 Tax=Chromobacterium alticapitis TaxID=2073169 RepID=A0A2S5DDV9_9NEIS|nr:type IV pilin [Chromobacterium alticapitis]
MRGVSLIELVITMAVIGILTAIAYPAYTSYLQQSRRSDAMQALTLAQSQMEQCYAQYFAYNNAACAVSATSPSGYYTVQIASGATASSYSLTATVVAAGLQGRDSSCNSFTISNAGIKSATNAQGGDSSSTCWPN